MQIFLFGALAISLIAVVFALQNNVPVMVTFLGWTFEGSLALVVFLAVVAGATASLLASLPALVRGRWALSQSRKQIASLETSLAEAQRRPSNIDGPSQPVEAQPAGGDAGPTLPKPI